MRSESKAVKYWWFNTRRKKLVTELYAKSSFEASSQVNDHFHTAQKNPETLSKRIKSFYTRLMRVRHDTYSLKDIGKIHQTTLPFVLDDGITYAETRVVMRFGVLQEIWYGHIPMYCLAVVICRQSSTHLSHLFFGARKIDHQG